MSLLQRGGPRHRPAASSRFQRPAQVIATGFGAAILIGTALLSIPLATETGKGPSLLDAVFTATSAVTLTGLVTVDTGEHWSTFGELVILGLIQVGGLGIMTLATLFAVLMSGRLGLRARLLAQAETKALGLADVRRVIRNIVIFSLSCEAVVAIVLTVRFMTAYGKSFGAAAYDGVFHGIAAFNSAGISLNSDSLMRFVADPWVSLPVAIAILLGAIGFPVVFELAHSWRPRGWSVLTRITLVVSGALLASGAIVVTLSEFSNPRTLGPLSGPAKILAGFFTAVNSQSGGFNSIDVSAMRPESWLMMEFLMFVGGGSAGTAGGIKVTTFGLLAFVIWAEIRGETRVNVGRRRIPESNQRQALAVALLGIGLVAVATFAMLHLTQHSTDRVLFDAVSAVGTVGLSTGIMADLSTAGQLMITTLMFIGRIGPLTVASALALRERARRFELPEERTIVG